MAGQQGGDNIPKTGDKQSPQQHSPEGMNTVDLMRQSDREIHAKLHDPNAHLTDGQKAELVKYEKDLDTYLKDVRAAESGNPKHKSSQELLIEAAQIAKDLNKPGLSEQVRNTEQAVMKMMDQNLSPQEVQAIHDAARLDTTQMDAYIHQLQLKMNSAKLAEAGAAGAIAGAVGHAGLPGGGGAPLSGGDGNRPATPQ